ncbi:HAMP domain-containing sensor histidine kinase [Crocosphaera sp. XPORK-15E]|uniref:sensor histidine kinase n=1 Tax=Crocosphaera sp. XPORK-15E TaxID=3110247 RepID=UPI002B21C0D7|nr:HAMP domain-containing sensor histidine kinase [Crocosphaera sp. XPORK-15E]MEA5535650.1 HAMP domain-containing sensor histidine kinase [Crocosphaera sp. XPORK-15E]
MFQNLRVRLLLSYLIVMEAILIFFCISIYVLFSQSLSRQLDNKLITLAEIVALTFSQVKHQGTQYFTQLDDDNLFDSQTQTIEWFDSEKHRLGSHGNLVVPFEPQPGLLTLYIPENSSSSPIRTITLSVSLNSSNFQEPSLNGYIRISQSLAELETEKNQLLLNLGIATLATLGLVTLGGFWLTKNAVKPIEKSVQQQKQFTADASHELRGPLTAIKASIDIMRRHPERLHDKDLRKVGAIASATEKMIHLVEDLLFLARTDTPTLQSNPEWTQFLLNDLLQDLVDLLEPLAQEKKITLDYQDLDKVWVMGNPEQLNRLFSNLIYNALNYTPSEGFVIIRLVQNNHLVKVSVKDTGIGIKSEDLLHIFDRFWRADKVRYRTGGTGLGLSIAQSITHYHRGKITVESKIGIGSCFEVSLPIVEAKNKS